VLTRRKKAAIIQRFNDELAQSELELDQLNFQLHKAIREHKTKHEQHEIRARYNRDIKIREDKIKNLSFKIQQINQLDIGIEIQEGTVKSIFDINEGDLWPDLENEPEILIEDGIVKEIRESRNKDDRMV
jgi:hypothetical protein